jgi:hypothetical protein
MAKSMKRQSPARHYCTFCGRKIDAKYLVKIHYTLLKKDAFHCQKCLSANADVLHRVIDEKSKYLIELFSGSKTVSTIAETEFDYSAVSIDNNAQLSPSICTDIMHLKLSDLKNKKDCRVIWASPPCPYFSKLTIAQHWKKITKAHRQYIYMPQTSEAWSAIKIVERTLWLIKKINPTFYFIENPQGVMRHLAQLSSVPFRYTVSYSDYGIDVYKPTDIFTNCPGLPLKKIIRNVREMPAGTVAKMNNSFERSKVPVQLIRTILQAIN